tara:strand:+ start:2700 stop:3080 length:381 start_codon:yes stop_codon:yes gene_type:complete
MAFPDLAPTSRSFESGDYPVKTFKAQNGAEHRILYGSNRTNMKLSLSYANITDTQADDFIAHYDEVKGSFQTFDLVANAKSGWEGTSTALDGTAQGNKYRYEGPPQIVQVRPGVSTVTVNLIGVLT